MLYNDYATRYTGPEIDLAITIALGLNPGENGWLKIVSTEENPIDVDTLKNPGNYTINFIINGSDLMNNTKPINMSIILINEELYQFSLVWDRIEYRKYINKVWTPWTSAKSSSYIYQQDTAPEYPEDHALWINTITHELSMWNGTTWVPIQPADMMRKSIYDEDDVGMDFYDYMDSIINSLIVSLGLDTFGDLIHSHINNTPIHTTSEEKAIWDAKESSQSANEKIGIALGESKDYTDEKFSEIAPILNDMTSGITELDTTLTGHINNNTIHITPAERTSWDAKADGNHSHINDGRVKIDATDIIAGVIPIDRIPHGALERLTKVPNKSAMLALTMNEVRNGDSVYVIDAEEFYFVIDDTKLNLIDSYMLYSTGVASSVSWQNIQNKPTTIAGYGITDAYTITQLNLILNNLETSLQNYIDGKFNEVNKLTVLYDLDIVNCDPDLKSHMQNVVYHDGQYVAVGYTNGTILTSPDGITWTKRDSGSIIDGFTDIVYGNNQYVVVGDSSTILTSPDAITWTKRTSGVTNGLFAITYGNNQYVAVGNDGTILTSLNGIAWTKRTSGVTGDSFENITYGNNQYVVVAYSGTILTSPDGIVWTKRTSGVNTQLNSVIYANNQYIVVGSRGNILTSPDGIEWTKGDSGVTDDWLIRIIYNNNQYVIVGGLYVAGSYIGTILTSPDGIVWTKRTSGANDALRGITYGNNQYVAVGDAGLTILFKLKNIDIRPAIDDLYSRAEIVESKLDEVYYNDQELQISVKGLPDILSVISSVFYNSEYVILAQCKNPKTGVLYKDILVSKDGITWTHKTANNLPKGYRLFQGGSYFVMFVDNGADTDIYTSSNSSLTSWTKRFTVVGNKLFSMAYTVNKYVAVGSGGVVATSTNGTTWIAQTSGTTKLLRDVAYIGGKFIAIGTGVIRSSSDGVTWTTVTISGINNVDLTQIVGDIGQYMMIGWNAGKKYIYHSTDGIVWANYDSGDTWIWTSGASGVDGLMKLIYANGQYVAVGQSGNIATSPDGITWTKRTSGTTFTLSGITYGNGLYVAVGEGMFTSPDGIVWTQRNTGTDVYLDAMVYENNKFVAVGYEYNDGHNIGVNLISSDGITWTKRTSGTTTTLSGITYGNGLYVAMGVTTDAEWVATTHIYTSNDGIDWAKNSTVLSGQALSLYYMNNQFTLLIREGYSDILTSPDGINWVGTSDLTIFYGATYANNRYTAVGQNGTIISSSDGIVWTKGTSGTAVYLDGITHGNNKYVVVGGDIILTSPGPIDRFNFIAYQNNKFMSFGYHPTNKTLIMGISTDRINWVWLDTNLHVTPIRNVHYNSTNKEYVIICDKETVVIIEERENVKLIKKSLELSLTNYPQIQDAYETMNEVNINILSALDMITKIEGYTKPEPM